MNRSASASAERALPCLNSNNCIETANSGEIKQLPSQYENRKADTLNEFSTSYKKSTKPHASQRKKAEANHSRPDAETCRHRLQPDKDRERF